MLYHFIVYCGINLWCYNFSLATGIRNTMSQPHPHPRKYPLLEFHLKPLRRKWVYHVIFIVIMLCACVFSIAQFLYCFQRLRTDPPVSNEAQRNGRCGHNMRVWDDHSYCRKCSSDVTGKYYCYNFSLWTEIRTIKRYLYFNPVLI